MDRGERDFRPPAGLRSPHTQSILATLDLRARWVERKTSGIRAVSRDVILECEDGTRIVAAHAPAPNAGTSKGTVTLLHGWEGSANSAYLVLLARHLYREGYEVYRVNFPDHGGTHELNKEIFHSCRLDEIVLAVREIVRRSPGERHLLLGFSLGGNFALRIAAVAPERELPLDRVVAICPVIDPAHTVAAIESAPWFYQARFLQRWTNSLRKKEQAFPHLYPLDPLGPATLRDRTELLVRRFTDFSDAAEYFNGYSIAADRLARVRCATTILASEDDPIIPVGDVRELRVPDCVEIDLQRWGGHCGFIENLRLESWAEWRIGRIFAKRPVKTRPSAFAHASIPDLADDPVDRR